MAREIGLGHRPFYDHLKAGGRVWRDDSHNDVREVLTAEKIGGAERIEFYGYLDLTIMREDDREEDMLKGHE